MFFTGLDDSAQCALARSFGKGAPAVARDDAFGAVPADVRPALLYRPAAARKTRDLIRQVDGRTFVARPFFQPFLPMIRARAPWMPAALALAATLLVAAFVLRGMAGKTHRTGRALLLCGGLLVFWVLLDPWLVHFPLGPYAEGPATLFAMLALAIAFASGFPGEPSRSRPASELASGVVEGLLLGLSATFHPTLAAYAVPIALFSILRRGSGLHTAMLALGALAGLSPLALSTRYITAPYGNFLHVGTLCKMIRGSADIRALALALAGSIPIGAVGLALAHSQRLRVVTARPRIRSSAAIVSGLVAVLALGLACLHPASRQALGTDIGDFLPALPHLVAAIVLALAWRRPATCALLAGCTLAALPFFIVQGQEIHVGIWSLRRAFPPFALLSLAALLGAFETDAAEASSPELFRRRAAFRRGWALLLMPAAMFQLCRMSPWDTIGERGAAALVDAVEQRLDEGALYLFERIPEAAPFAGLPNREVFGLNDRVSNALGHAAVVRWLRVEAEMRPVYVVALRDVAGTVLDGGIVLVPEGKPIVGEIRRSYGRTFRDARPGTTRRVFTFLRVCPADSSAGREAVSRGIELSPGAASPFGLTPGAWDIPRRGREGRWAADGAAFWGPIPQPGDTMRVRVRATWWTREGTNAPVQRLRIEPPYAGISMEAELAPSPDPSDLVLDITRFPLHDSSGTSASVSVSEGGEAVRREPSCSGFGLYRIRGEETYDERGFPPALIAEIHAVRL